MTIEEIKEKYPSHWVGLAQPQYKDKIELLGGNVMVAETNHIKADIKMGKIRGVRLRTTIYTGIVDDTPMI